MIHNEFEKNDAPDLREDELHQFRSVASTIDTPSEYLWFSALFLRFLACRKWIGGEAEEQKFWALYLAVVGVMNTLNIRLGEVLGRPWVQDWSDCDKRFRALLPKQQGGWEVANSFLSEIRNLSDEQSSLLAVALSGCSLPCIGAMVSSRTNLSLSQAIAVAGSFFYRAVVQRPESAILIPPKLIEVFHDWEEMEPPVIWINSNLRDLWLERLAEQGEPPIISFASGISTHECYVLYQLILAGRDRFIGHVDDAVKDTQEATWFFASRSDVGMPSESFFRFDGTLNMLSILNAVRQSEVLYEGDQWAVFDLHDRRRQRFFLRFPSTAQYFCSASSVALEQEYTETPLQFLLNHRDEAGPSQGLRLLRAEEASLKAFRSALAVEGAIRYSVREARSVVAKAARRSMHAAPEALLLGLVFYELDRVVGLAEPERHAMVEALATLIVRGVFGTPSEDQRTGDSHC